MESSTPHFRDGSRSVPPPRAVFQPGFVAVVAATLLAGLACRSSERPVPRPTVPPDLLLVTVDTVRADHLGCYGYGPPTTPVLNGIASRGVLFDEAHSLVPLTLPSHAVLLSGELPSTLKVRVNGLRVGREVETLATRLAAMGYWTGAAVGSSILDRDSGLAAGFRAFDDSMTVGPPGGGARVERPAVEVTRAALSLLGGARGPVFLWVHYYDPHAPYIPPEPFAGRFPSSPYDGEIASMDASIGELVEGFRARRPASPPLIVVAGDHGEGLGEHGEKEHGIFLYEYALRVPLLMEWDGSLPEGCRVKDLCGLNDVAPTLLDLMGFGVPAVRGKSLRPLIEGRPEAPRRVPIESYQGYFDFGWAPLRGVVDGRWKFIEAPTPELYDWRRGESRNEYAPGHAAVKRGRLDLAAIPALAPEEIRAMRGIGDDPAQAENLKKLQSLGYLSGGSPAPATAGLRDPKTEILLEGELADLSAKVEGGGALQVIPRALEILKDNPQNVRALSLLGLAYLKSRKFPEARACFEREIQLRPSSAIPHLNLGTVFKESGSLAPAEKEYRAALALAPRYPEAVANLAWVVTERGRKEEARKLLDGAISGGVLSADIWFEKGFLEAERRRWKDSREAFQRSAALNPRRRATWENLAKVYLAEGNPSEAAACRLKASQIR